MGKLACAGVDRRCRSTVAGLLMVAGQPVIAAIMFVAGLAVAAFAYLKTPAPRIDDEVLRSEPDYALVGSALGLSNDPIALTSGEGSLLIVNSAYRERFGGAPPPLEVAASDEARQGLKLAQTMAWRDGAGCVADDRDESGTMPVEVERVGAHSDLLLPGGSIKSAAARSDQCRYQTNSGPRRRAAQPKPDCSRHSSSFTEK